jgi:undecaprenyl-diphosphatase
MKDVLTSLFLGMVEGLTEFIPVSSTAHLIVLVDGLNFPSPPGHFFEIFIQLGAIFAVIFQYRTKIFHTLTHFWREEESKHFAQILIAGTIPALIVGFLGRDWIKAHLYNPHAVAAALIVGGIIILLLEKRLKNPRIETINAIPLKTALWVGCFQSIALIPGISRSGATIMGALGLGFARPVAAEFSFFLAVPVMCLAVAYDGYKSLPQLSAYPHPELLLAGFLSAFVTALIVIRLVLSFVSRYGFAPFAWYRIAAGILILSIF